MGSGRQPHEKVPVPHFLRLRTAYFQGSCHDLDELAVPASHPDTALYLDLDARSASRRFCISHDVIEGVS